MNEGRKDGRTEGRTEGRKEGMELIKGTQSSDIKLDHG